MPEIPLIITVDTTGTVRVCGRVIARVDVPVSGDQVGAAIDAVASRLRDGLWKEDDTLF